VKPEPILIELQAAEDFVERQADLPGGYRVGFHFFQAAVFIRESALRSWFEDPSVRHSKRRILFTFGQYSAASVLLGKDLDAKKGWLLENVN